MIGYIGAMAAKGYTLIVGPHATNKPLHGFFARFTLNTRAPAAWADAGHGKSIEEAVEAAYKLANNIPTPFRHTEDFE